MVPYLRKGEKGLKKQKVIELTICDFCSEEAELKCECCGKDICKECARWICKKKSSPQSGGPSLSWSSWSTNYDPYPWKWVPEKVLCKDCTEKFKLSIGVLAGEQRKK